VSSRGAGVGSFPGCLGLAMRCGFLNRGHGHLWLMNGVSRFVRHLSG
jgi:hypothetical protein